MSVTRSENPPASPKERSVFHTNSAKNSQRPGKSQRRQRRQRRCPRLLPRQSR